MRRPKLGQHFLKDARYAQRSVDAADLRADDIVLEVGPGKGVLTRILAPRVAKVVAIELDPALADGMERAGIPNVEIVRGDAVQAPLPAFTACVSNLPYQISSPFLFRLLSLDFRIAVLLVQKEFAHRLVAKVDTAEYGRLSVNAQRKAKLELIATIPPGAFDPPPKVESCIVRITPRAPGFVVPDEALYDRVVEAAFGERRKKLANALSSFGARTVGMPHADQRAGELSPSEFAAVTAHILEKRA